MLNRNNGRKQERPLFPGSWAHQSPGLERQAKGGGGGPGVGAGSDARRAPLIQGAWWVSRLTPSNLHTSTL